MPCLFLVAGAGLVDFPGFVSGGNNHCDRRVEDEVRAWWALSEFAGTRMGLGEAYWGYWELLRIAEGY